MKPDEQDELLNELLSGEEVSDFRKASLERGLATMRSRRRQRRAIQALVMVLLPLLAMAGILLHQRRGQPIRQVASVKPAAAVSVTSATTTRDEGVKVITDEELFALFPGRSMALVGKPGEQKLVFLDGGSARGIVR